MSRLSDLLSSRTALAAAEVDVLQALVGEWQLVSDLSFADLVLWVPLADERWMAVAHKRPNTGTTTRLEEVIGLVLPPDRSSRLLRAYREDRIVRDRESASVRVDLPRASQEAIPVRAGGRVIAVLTCEVSRAVSRTPSPLELAYQTSAGELLQMVSEGTFPYPDSGSDQEASPRAGDGLLRLDRTGHVVYASPNALSAFRRLGISADLLGAHLGQAIAVLSAQPGQLDEPRGSAALAAALRFREPRDTEVEARGVTVHLRVMPMVLAGEPRGVLVLLRDVTELRRRDLQIMGKDATIREIHHRVKNNLQTVAALLRLQARRLDDPAARAALEESVRRVGSIAVVHETLSSSLEEQVDFDDIADKVLAMCAEVAVPEAQVRVCRKGEFGILSAPVATPLSMVLTELVQNAVEHGYPTQRRAHPGQVDVLVERSPEQLLVLVCDDGVGLPDDRDQQPPARLGLQIVRTLVESELRGSLVVAPGSGGGAQVELRVPLALPRATAEP